MGPNSEPLTWDNFFIRWDSSAKVAPWIGNIYTKKTKWGQSVPRPKGHVIMGLFWHGAKFPIGIHCRHSGSITVERLTLGASNLVCSQKIMILGQKNLTPKMGVAYGHVTSFAISEIVISPERLMLQSSNFVCYQISLVLSIKRNLTPKWAWLIVTWPLSKFQKNPHISGMAQGRILKFGLLSEINRPMWYTKFNP